MAKHRAGRRSTRERRPGRAAPVVLTSAVVVSIAAAGGVAVTAPETVASTMYDLSALIVEGSSTNPTGAGIEDFYRGAFATGRDVVTVNFLTGPFGIHDALADNAADDDNVVISSGWGAANASLLLSYLEATGGDDAVATNAVYVLDNNVARPNGGFGTRYPVFGLIGVNPVPTPTAPGVPVIDVGYEYDINGNTPAYVLNGIAMANSLMAYFDRRLNQNDLDLPVSIVDGQVEVRPGCETRCWTKDGWVRVERVGDTTYVSYEAGDLPLTRPLRRYGGVAGERLADAIDPALRAIVDYGYPNNDPLADPGTYRPVGLLPSLRETQKFFDDFAAGVREGWESLDGAGDRTRRDGEPADEDADADPVIPTGDDRSDDVEDVEEAGLGADVDLDADADARDGEGLDGDERDNGEPDDEDAAADDTDTGEQASADREPASESAPAA